MKSVLLVSTVITVTVLLIHHAVVAANDIDNLSIESPPVVDPAGVESRKKHHITEISQAISTAGDLGSGQKKVLTKNQIAPTPTSSKKDSSAIDSVKTFNIVTGTVKENAENLLRQFGWTIYRWDSSNFYIDAEYAVEISSLSEGLDFLLDPYPIQAQMINVNKTVLFVTKSKVQSK